MDLFDYGQTSAPASSFPPVESAISGRKSGKMRGYAFSFHPSEEDDVVTAIFCTVSLGLNEGERRNEGARFALMAKLRKAHFLRSERGRAGGGRTEALLRKESERVSEKRGPFREERERERDRK